MTVDVYEPFKTVCTKSVPPLFYQVDTNLVSMSSGVCVCLHERETDRERERSVCVPGFIQHQALFWISKLLWIYHAPVGLKYD